MSRGGAEVLRIGVVSADDVFAAATGAFDEGHPTGEDVTARQEAVAGDDAEPVAGEDDAARHEPVAAEPETVTADTGSDDEEPRD